MSVTRAETNAGRRRLELIEYPEGEDLVDHKGRSKPLYKPSSPRPDRWRPDSSARLLLGLFPGLRLMVTRSVPMGLPYAVLGLLAGLGALLVVLTWSVSAASIEHLRIQPHWVLIRATSVLVLVGAYELLRFGAAIEEQPRGPRLPRILSALTLPAFLVILAAPAFMDAAPRAVEATWFAALIVGFGSLPAAAACALDAVASQRLTQLRLPAVLTLVILVIVAASLPFLGVPLIGDLSAASRAAGFRVLPNLLP